MDYASDKAEVLLFFDEYVIKYLLPDLRVLNTIEPDQNGVGACAVPQAVSSFAAVDLCGFLIDPNPGIPSLVNMKLKSFLKNPVFFPELQSISNLDTFLNSFRDDVRSIMTHRFFPVQYDIAKLPDQELFLQKGAKKVFNVRYFTTKVVAAIELLYHQISTDGFILAGDSTKEQTMKWLRDRIEALRNYQGDQFSVGSAYGTSSSSTTLQTTQSLNR